MPCPAALRLDHCWAPLAGRKPCAGAARAAALARACALPRGEATTDAALANQPPSLPARPQVAAGSLVLKAVPPHTLVAGTPAREVGTVTGNPALSMEQWSVSKELLKTNLESDPFAVAAAPRSSPSSGSSGSGGGGSGSGGDGQAAAAGPSSSGAAAAAAAPAPAAAAAAAASVGPPAKPHAPSPKAKEAAQAKARPFDQVGREGGTVLCAGLSCSLHRLGWRCSPP